jgi:hypothetical protein
VKTSSALPGPSTANLAILVYVPVGVAAEDERFLPQETVALMFLTGWLAEYRPVESARIIRSGRG